MLAATTVLPRRAAAGATVMSMIQSQVLLLVGENASLIAEETAAGRNVVIVATADDETIIVTVAGAATTGTAGIAGAIPTIVSESTVRAGLGNKSHAEAGDSVVIYADLQTGLYDVAGGFSAGSTAGVGATINSIVLNNRVEALFGEKTTVIACDAGVGRHEGVLRSPTA